MVDTENWAPVLGFESLYEVSDLGRVRSLSRIVPCKSKTRLHKGKLLRPVARADGRLIVGLCKNGVSVNRFVHRLVLEAFVGECPPALEACHFNGEEADNRLVNLRWDTRKANREDGRRLGEIKTGSRRANSKLTETDIPGWCACITVREVTSSAAQKIRKDSVGFAGYDWMITALERYGRILTDREVKTVLARKGEELEMLP